MTTKAVNSNLIKSLVDAFKEKNSSVNIPQSLTDAVSEVERQNTIFEQGANNTYKRWLEFSDALDANRGANISYENTEEFNNILHDYMDWQKSGNQLLTDAEKTKYTLQNFEMNNKPKMRQFLKKYRNYRKNSGQEGIIKYFKEYKAKINEGSYRYFLKNEYQDAANEVLTRLKTAEQNAMVVDGNLYDTLKEAADDFKEKTIGKSKIVERNLFGKFDVRRAGRLGLMFGISAVCVLGIIRLCKDIIDEKKEDDEFLAKHVYISAVSNNTDVNVSENDVKTVSADVSDDNKSATDVANTDAKKDANSEILSDAINMPKAAEQINNADEIAERRRQFEQAVDNARNKINLDGVESEIYTIAKGDSMWKIAKKSLVKDGVSNPVSKDVIKRIALIALLNEQIDKVTEYLLLPGNTLKVPNNATVAYIESNPEYSRILSSLADIYV